MKKAFTLAEVLITLGIIGVVAALTMPALIANNRKKILETRIKKFYSVINQAVMMKIAEDDSIDYTMLTIAYEPTQILDFIDKNYTQYLKMTDIKKLTKGVAAGLPDGSGMYIYKTYVNPSGQYGSIYILFCAEYKNCKNINEAGIQADGKNLFMFWTNGEVPQTEYENREELLSLCASNPSYCTTLLAHDEWEIKDDYPYKP
ncbi:MAG: type II secretion system GspH family protein [Heliobacteriaceae bacterium]|nr:type II secretion system GspH family protein [Heliobacteriaceae bacterium]